MDDLTARARQRAEELTRTTYAGHMMILPGQHSQESASLLTFLADRVDEQAKITEHAAPIAYAAEEWFHGRISDDDLRATIANVLSQKGGG